MENYFKQPHFFTAENKRSRGVAEAFSGTQRSHVLCGALSFLSKVSPLLLHQVLKVVHAFFVRNHDVDGFVSVHVVGNDIQSDTRIVVNDAWRPERCFAWRETEP